MSKVPDKQPGDPETTGHSWDGIEEFNNPLPRWWVWVFYLTIIWGVGYSIAYPAWPGISSATSGLLGWSSRAKVQAEIDAADMAHAGIRQQIENVELAAINGNPELASYASQAGASVFRTWCAQCHGAGAAGAKGYPNLLDDDWLWGGDIEAIATTIRHGIRNEEDPDARWSQMPAFGRDELLEEPQIDAVVNYVMSLSGEPRDASVVEEGSQVFADNCAACHGENAEGDRTQGAPNLADAIWLYGGDYDTLHATVTNARFGVMPSWTDRLSEAEIRSVATYVHGLGGGE